MIKLIKSTFFDEAQTKAELNEFIAGAEILSMGPQCRLYEENFARKQGRKFAVFVSSGSTANLLLIQALRNLNRLRAHDRVGFSALTWPTNIMPLLQLSLQPQPIDCEINTLNVSPETLTPHLASIQAMFLTNVLGFCDRIDEIERLCREKNIILLEDNCESLGSVYQDRLLGNFSLASTFSFFVGHHLSTIEGGMICTDDEELYRMLVLIRAHGWDRNLPAADQQQLRQQHQVDQFFAKYTFYDLAYNARPTEINGWLGNKQIGYWDTIVDRRQQNFRAFHQTAKQNPQISPLEVDHMAIVSNFSMPVVFRTVEAFQAYRQKFQAAEVEIRPIIAGDMTQQPFFQKYVPRAAACPNAQFIHRQGFYFGNNPDQTSEEIQQLVSLLS